MRPLVLLLAGALSCSSDSPGPQPGPDPDPIVPMPDGGAPPPPPPVVDAGTPRPDAGPRPGPDAGPPPAACTTTPARLRVAAGRTFQGLTADATSLYFIEQRNQGRPGEDDVSAIFDLPLANLAAATPRDTLLRGVEVRRLHQDGPELFWRQDVSGAYGVFAGAKSGGAKIQIYDAPPAGDFIVDGPSVYILSRIPGTPLVRVARQGGPRTTIVPDADGLTLSHDATHLYYTDWAAGTYRVDKSGATPPELRFTEYSSVITDLALDAAMIYVVTSDGIVARAAKTGGSPTPIAAFSGTGWQLERDGGFLYFVQYPPDTAPSVVRVPVAGGVPQVVGPGGGGFAVAGGCLYYNALTSMGSELWVVAK